MGQLCGLPPMQSGSNWFGSGADQCPDFLAAGKELVDDLAAEESGAADNQDRGAGNQRVHRFSTERAR